jgi:hypothetical protein
MSDDDTPTPLKVFGAEIRLRSGQLVQMNEGGTVEVVSPSKEIKVTTSVHHYKMSVSYKQDYNKSVAQVCSDDYDSLIIFLKQLERLDYLMLNIERVEGIVPRLN